MNLDKHLPNGTVIEAPAFIKRVVHGIPVLFQLVEWLLFIVAFQYVDQKFKSLPAKFIWLLLALALGVYIGAIASSVAWRYIADPFKSWLWSFLMYFILPGAAGALVFWLLNVLVRDMVAAQVG